MPTGHQTYSLVCILRFFPIVKAFLVVISIVFVTFEGISIHPATLTSNFFIPFWRELILRVGAISVSAFSLKVLSRTVLW
jgi:hypothetical protein